MGANVGSDVRPCIGSSLEARMLHRLLHSVGDPPIEFHLLWSGEREPPSQYLTIPNTNREQGRAVRACRVQ
jgi:hypothetical protein